jgi:hypothetical protein
MPQQFVPPSGRTRVGPRAVTVRETVPQVVETVTVLRPETRATDRGQRPEDWGWEELRDYLVRNITARFGPFPMQQNPAQLAGIVKGFLRRHGAQAGPIAVAAFETFGGYWKGSPIAIQRFCANSDPYFAEPIAERITT